MVKFDNREWNVYLESDGLYMETLDSKRKIKVSIDDETVGEDEIAILNHSEYQGVVEALIYGNVIDKNPIGFIDLGLIKPRIYKLKQGFLMENNKKECLTQIA